MIFCFVGLRIFARRIVRVTHLFWCLSYWSSERHCVLLSHVQKFDVKTWKDPRKVVDVNADGHTLEAFKFRLSIRLNNLESDNFGRVGDYHARIYTSRAVFLQLWRLLLIGLDACVEFFCRCFCSLFRSSLGWHGCWQLPAHSRHCYPR